MVKTAGRFIWAHLLHLGFNMWEETQARVPADSGPRRRKVLNMRRARPYLRYNEGFAADLLRRMVAAGINKVVLDLGDGVRYESHPEIAVRHAWTPKRLRAELDKMRRMGLEPIPKLNFSATHDAWLGPYSRCVSSDAYYAVCRDLIAEAIDLFDRPRLFHIGMDEETAQHQRFCNYAVIRQGDLWWHDLRFLIAQVERGNARPWMWADYVWHHPDEFFRKMPKSVLQSNWHYDAQFRKTNVWVKAYLDLEARGYDQVPTASNDVVQESFGNTVRYCRRHIAPERLLGFVQSTWAPTLKSHRRQHLDAIRAVAEVTGGTGSQHGGSGA